MSNSSELDLFGLPKEFSGNPVEKRAELEQALNIGHEKIVQRFGTLARTDSACLQVQEVEQESGDGTPEYRDDRRSVKGGRFHPAAVTASDGYASDARGEGARGGSGRC